MDNRVILKAAKPLLEPRIYTLKEVKLWLDEIINEDVPVYHVSLLCSKNNWTTVISILQDVLDFLNKNGVADLETFARGQLTERYGLKLKHIAHPIRIAISGKEISLPLFQSMKLIGDEICIKRVNEALRKLDEQKEKIQQEKQNGTYPG